VVGLVHSDDTLADPRVLDWEPKTQLREGLGRTIAYFEQVLSSAGAA
jgi:hypothetical protein